MAPRFERAAGPRMARGQATADSQALALEGARATGDRQLPARNDRWQSGDDLRRPKQAVEKRRWTQRVGTGDYRRPGKWQHMQCGVLPQANQMGVRVRMLVHRPGVVFIQMQSPVIVVVVTVALGMDCHVVEFGRPAGRNPGGEQRGCLPGYSQHQQECANRARHAPSLAASPPFNWGKSPEPIANVCFSTTRLAASGTRQALNQPARFTCPGSLETRSSGKCNRERHRPEVAWRQQTVAPVRLRCAGRRYSLATHEAGPIP